MSSSVKHKGADSILYKATKGTLVDTAVALADDSWYKIVSFASAASALPDMDIGSMFKTPQNAGDAITLTLGDSVYPLTLTEVCKVDVEVAGEKSVIDVTDSCDYPYMANMPDGFTNLSGSINTMLRFDEETDELTDVSKEFLNKFFDVVEDDGEGGYVVTSMNDDDLLLLILLNQNVLSVSGKVETWILTPAMLSGVTNNIAMKDVMKADYSWSKGQGPATLYKRTVPAS